MKNTQRLIPAHFWQLRLLLVLAFTLTGAQARTLAADDDVRVSILPRMLFVGQDTHVTVRITPKEENRLLRVILDGPSYYASTEVQLDGADAARTHDIWWHKLPAGAYTMWVNLERASERPIRQHFLLTVAGGDDGRRR